jgi:putative ABC transport system permease protein
MQSFWRLQRVPPGFDPHQVLTVNLSLPEGNDPELPARHTVFYRQLLEKTSALPGVRAASAVWPLPLSGSDAGTGVDVAGRPTAPSDRAISRFRAVAPNYFRAMRIPLRAGRDFEARDDSHGPGVAIINESFARTYFPKEDPLGRRITPQMSAEPRDPIEREIIGIVGDVKFLTLGAEVAPEVYVPHGQFPIGSLTLVALTEKDPESLLPALRRTVSELDANLALYRPRTMEQYLAASVAQPRLNMVLLAIFGLVAATLTAVGLYGVMAYSVSQRTQEIGIRLTLGAQKANVLRLIAAQGFQLTLLGVGLGLPAAWAATRLLSSLLYGVGATDAVTFAVVAVFLSAVALAACYMPSRRAANLDPMIALRAE